MCILVSLPFTMKGQGDSLLSVTIISKKPLPQIGLGADGKKYFVMSTNQDRRTLIELRKELFKDSMLVYYEELSVTQEKEIGLLKGRLKDRGNAIDEKNATIIELEKNFKDSEEKLKNSEKNVKDLNQYIKRQKVVRWFAFAVGITGAILYIDSKVN
jgi:peptidoglycan hydrolase CwlO-like protein